MSPPVWAHCRSIGTLRGYKLSSSLVCRQQLRKHNFKLRQGQQYLVPQAVHSSCYGTKTEPVHEEPNGSSPARNVRVGGNSTDSGDNGGRNPMLEATLTAAVGLGMGMFLTHSCCLIHTAVAAPIPSFIPLDASFDFSSRY
jgi:hypothetical protein